MKINETIQKFNRKAQVFIKVINAVPDGSIWGLQEVNQDIWIHFNGDWNKINPYLISSNRVFEYICYPDLYINLTRESKKILSELLMSNPIAINYFWHNIFFKDDLIYAEIIEGNQSMDILRVLNIDIVNNEDWVHFI
jgi:hypothetical protein